MLRSPYTRLAPRLAPRLVPRQVRPISSSTRGALRSWSVVVNIIAGAYIGGLVVCGGSLYLLYHDANSRQNIPFSLSLKQQLTAVMAINKDDVLRSPRYAVKHYRRLLLEIAGVDDTELQQQYIVPLLDADDLVYRRSAKFSNFYIDIVLRYSRALLAKGELDSAVAMLKAIIDNDVLFYKLGDAERLAQCCRLLSKVCQNPNDKVLYLLRSLDMLETTFAGIKLDENYLLDPLSKITDELVSLLNTLAFVLAQSSKSASRKDKADRLTKAMNIYLANLGILQQVNTHIVEGTRTQMSYPLFDCDPAHLEAHIAELKAHISEIMWARGYKKDAIAWAEEVVAETYNHRVASARVAVVLDSVLTNLTKMYHKTRDYKNEARCVQLHANLDMFDESTRSWYDSVVNRFCKIIYWKGPLGILEKGLTERFGRPTRVPEIEEFEQEDVE